VRSGSATAAVREADGPQQSLVDIDKEHPARVGEIVGFNDASMVREFKLIKINRMLTPPNRRGPDNRWPVQVRETGRVDGGENVNVHAGLSNV
jgi:hypothetical protein